MIERITTMIIMIIILIKFVLTLLLVMLPLLLLLQLLVMMITITIFLIITSGEQTLWAHVILARTDKGSGELVSNTLADPL